MEFMDKTVNAVLGLEYDWDLLLVLYSKEDPSQFVYIYKDASYIMLGLERSGISLDILDVSQIDFFGDATFDNNTVILTSVNTVIDEVLSVVTEGCKAFFEGMGFTDSLSAEQFYDIFKDFMSINDFWTVPASRVNDSDATLPRNKNIAIFRGNEEYSTNYYGSETCSIRTLYK